MRDNDCAWECVCIGVYGIERILLERRAEGMCHHPIEISLAMVEQHYNCPLGKSTDLLTPFAFASRELLRKLLLGQTCTFVPTSSSKIGHLYLCSPRDLNADDENLLVAAHLVRQGLAVVRQSSTPAKFGASSSHGVRQDTRRLALTTLEEMAKKKCLGVHGLGRLSDASRVIRPFPAEGHPYHTLLVQHLTCPLSPTESPSSWSTKLTVERIISPIVLEGTIVPSMQMIKVRIAGLLVPSGGNDILVTTARQVVTRTLLHRVVSVTLDSFDRATCSFYASVHQPVFEKHLVEKGLLIVDSKTLSYSTLSAEFLVAEEKAQQRGAGYWSDPHHSAQRCPQPPSTVVGLVTKITDEVTVEVHVDDVALERDGCEECTLTVRLAYLAPPEPPLMSRMTPSGRVVRYSARSFFGRELLRRYLIGRRVVAHIDDSVPGMSVRVGRIIPFVSPLDDESFMGAATPLDASIWLMRQAPSLFPFFCSVSHATPPSLDFIQQYFMSDPTVSSGAGGSSGRGTDRFADPAPPTDEGSVCPEGSADGADAVSWSRASKMDLLYVETPSHVADVFLRSGRLIALTEQPLPALVLGWTVDGSSLRLEVHLTSQGMVLPVRLAGVRLLSADAFEEEQDSDRESAVALLDEHLKRLRRVLRSVVQQEAMVLLRLADGSATAVEVALTLSLEGPVAEMLVGLGLAVPTKLLISVPQEPTLRLLVQQANAQKQMIGLWHPASEPLLRAMATQREQETGISRVASEQEQRCGIDIVPLAWVDHRTFTYRLLSDTQLHQKVKGLVAAARTPRTLKRIQEGDVVAAPYQDEYFRARVVSIQYPSSSTHGAEAGHEPNGKRRDLSSDCDQAICSVMYLDYGTLADGIPLSQLRVYYTKSINQLAIIPPLAKFARHAFLSIPAKFIGNGKRTLPRNSQSGISSLEELLLHKMGVLVSFGALTMFRMYTKENFEHVLIMPQGVTLRSDSVAPFEISLWSEVLGAQAAFTRGTELSLVSVDFGCGEYVQLVPWLHDFLTVPPSR